ncbi:MAG: putative permease [Bacteroidota bacterium]|jgi:hypothetical protein
MRLKDKIIFTLLFFVLLFISLNRHSRHPVYSYHSQLFADKAGYQVYLPAYFFYDMKASNMPNGILEKTGNGFRYENDKIITKYPIGVAFFQAPFFGIASLIDYLQGNKQFVGFTANQQQALNWATAFFTTIGFMLLFLTATRYWGLNFNQAYSLILSLLLCSNLLYYSTRDCGMSHAYSFFVFAAIQFFILKCLKTKAISGRDVMLLFVLFSLVIALRPLNLVFISLPLLYFILVFRKDIAKIKFKFNIGYFIAAFVLASIPLLLQGLYNVYAYDSFIADSYESESFSNLSSMDLLALWFSPNNGALLYSPILIGVFIWTYLELKAKNLEGFVHVLYFLLISLTYAAWWSPGLGCGFGHRGFTEHLAFFALPIGSLILPYTKSKLTIFLVLALSIGTALFVAQLNFDGCISGGIWEWNSFLKLFRV